jgi:hypothetical protein
MTEVRTVLWPAYETPEWSAAQYLQGIAGTLELFHRSTLSFQLASQSFGDPKVVLMVIVVAIVGLIILMPLSRALAGRVEPMRHGGYVSASALWRSV